MNLEAVLKQLDANAARAFVTAARHVIDALLIEGQRVAQAQPPTPRDYTTAKLSSPSPAGGWLSDEELRGAAQRMAEAMAAEKWVEGALFAIRLLSALGGSR